jgi:hypothetical protein
MEQWLKSINRDTGNYLSGFADGEGSFNVSLRKRNDHTMGWQVVLSFTVAQKESYILSQFKKVLGCGRLRKRSRDGLYIYEVNNPTSIKEKVIPFFRNFKFLSQSKKKNFSIFCKISDLVFSKKHLSTDGLRSIIEFSEELNQGKGRKRKYHADDVEKSFRENPQRLHAKPRAFRQEAISGG